jgi:hypothetical protein
MDTEIFLARCEALSDGLHKLSNDCHKSLKQGVPGEERNGLVRLAKEKITLYNELSSDIESEQEEEEMECFDRYIGNLKEFLKKA